MTGVAVIGRCSSAGCGRRASTFVSLRSTDGEVVTGSACARCARVTEAAAFLLSMLA
jgi:hypothetical protein